jgi:2-C-methyl-D-erythritol 2,4-cyclodiphosphate synthase
MNERAPGAGFRVGWGFDAHSLNTEPPLILGGVVVSESEGVSATSDGDVLAHAVTDAILGSCSLGDLGQHFPSDDPAYEGAVSMDFLARALSMVNDSGWKPVHVDVTVIAESIRISPHRETIRRNLAEVLNLDMADISVKATTTDGLGFIGTGEGVASMAVVTVQALS